MRVATADSIIPTPIVLRIGAAMNSFLTARNETTYTTTANAAPVAIAPSSASANGNLTDVSSSSPAKAPSMNVSPRAKFSRPSTPSTSVKPRAISAYVLPSSTPLTSCWRNTRLLHLLDHELAALDGGDHRGPMDLTIRPQRGQAAHAVEIAQLGQAVLDLVAVGGQVGRRVRDGHALDLVDHDVDGVVGERGVQGDVAVARLGLVGLDQC